MIMLSILAEQLREYQIRSKHDWASSFFFSSTSNLASSRVDVVFFVIWELVILAFLVFSAVSLYFRHFQFSTFIYFRHENCETSEIEHEKEEKDVASTVYVEPHEC